MPRGNRPPADRTTVEHPFRVLKRILGYVLHYYKLQYAIVVLMIVVGVLASVQGTLFIRSLIDDYITPMLSQQEPDFGPLAAAISRVALFYAIGVLSNAVRAYLMVFVTQGTLDRLRKDLFSHMEKLPIGYFDTHTRGDIMSVYTNDVDTLREMIDQSIPQLINSVFTVVMVLISMFALSVPLTLVTLAMVAVITIASGKLAGISTRFFAAQQRNIGTLNGYVEEMMTGQRVIKVFCHEKKAEEQFDQLNEALEYSSYNANRFAAIMGPVNLQLGNVSYVLCAAIGGAMAITGFTGLTLGALASFLTFNRNFTMPISQISQQANAIVMALAGGDRVFRLMDEEVEKDEGFVSLVRVREDEGALVETKERTGRWAWKSTNPDKPLVELKGAVVFENVDFGYIPEKTVLHNISLFAKPGQKIAFVGSTGAGKTTITNLINRFYNINSGTITYDGIDIRKIRKEELRRSLGIVLQETNLFTGTVMENIRYGRLDATDEEVIEAAKLANADYFIRRMPKGYDTVIKGNGSSLSQGERQLLSIARAACANPPVLILDEATSSIDTRTERIVQDGMDKLVAGRTSFVIAHRLSTVRNADCIMVLENGEIIERGTHDQLLEEKGRYYQLFTGKTE